MTESNDPADRRTAKRYAVNLPNRIVVDNKPIDCRLVDVSKSGALIETDSDVTASVGSSLKVNFPDGQEKVGKVVRLTATHIALSFPGELLVAPLLERAGLAPAG